MVISELNKKLTEKKYLAGRISREDVRESTGLLKTVSEEIPAITEEIPRVSLDKKMTIYLHMHLSVEQTI